jgi:hypothetical protein
MNSVLFIYIFSLFVITTPNFIFKTPIHSYWLSIAIHAVIFSCILYFTYNIVNRDVIEGKDFEVTIELPHPSTVTPPSTGAHHEVINDIKTNKENIAKISEDNTKDVATAATNAATQAQAAATVAQVSAAQAQASAAVASADQINGASTASGTTAATTGSGSAPTPITPTPVTPTPVTPTPPTEPGCYVYSASGCRKHKGFDTTQYLPNTPAVPFKANEWAIDSWGMKNAQSGESKGNCDKRGGNYDSWCKTTDFKTG